MMAYVEPFVKDSEKRYILNVKTLSDHNKLGDLEIRYEIFENEEGTGCCLYE